MWQCKNCSQMVEPDFAVCWNCGTSADGVSDPEFESQQDNVPSGDDHDDHSVPDGMLLVTTPTLENHQVEQYLGLVCNETVVALNPIRDIVAGLAEVVGGRNSTYEAELRKARKSAIAGLARRAAQMGANTVLSLKIDFEIKETTLVVTCYGTAARVIELG